MICSVLISVLESYNIIQRWILYTNKLAFNRDEFEFIFVDDGSDPPIEIKQEPNFFYRLLRREDTRPWTKAIAINKAFKHASGKYILIFDIDHMLTDEAINFIQNGWKKNKLLAFGTIEAELTDYGTICNVGKKKYCCGAGIRAMKSEEFKSLGGYDESLIIKNTQSLNLIKRYTNSVGNKQKGPVVGPSIYMYPQEIAQTFHGLYNKKGDR